MSEKGFERKKEERMCVCVCVKGKGEEGVLGKG